MADEVRRLAENSSQSTKQITGRIEELSTKIDTGVQLSDNTEKALHLIDSDIRTTTQIVQEISAALTEQDLGAGQILSSITSLVATTLAIKEVAHEQKTQNSDLQASIAKMQETFAAIKSAMQQEAQAKEEIVRVLANLENTSAQNIAVVQRLDTLITS